MKEIINVMSKMNLLALLLILGLSILAFKYKFKQLRNNKNKRVIILAIKDTNKILVKNKYYFLLKIDFWKKIFKSNKIINYMENEREICLIAIPNSKNINDKKQDTKIEKILKKYINKDAKIKYRFLRNRELPLFQKIALIRNYYGFKEKIKYFLSIFEFNYDYYFSVIAEKMDISKEIIEETGIWDKNDIEKAISLGANGVQMGTRFIGTHECDANIGFKEVLLAAEEKDIELIKSPVGYPARGIRTNLINLVDKRMGPKIQCISNCVSPCQRGKEAKQVGYCIADRLFDAYSGKKESGLFFTGANGYKLKELISVKELMHKLVHGE